MLIRSKIIYCFLIIFISINVSAAILDKNEAAQADLSTLQNETSVFQSIGMGIALSIAQCDGVDLCSFTVEEDEIQELINALENRIDSLILRQEETSDPEGFEKVLTAYVNERDNYNSHLEKLKNIASSLDSDSELLDDSLESEPDFPVEAARDAELLEYVEDELSIFEDEDIEDDEDLEDGDLPDLPGLEESITTP